MRVVVNEFMSLDGVSQAPGGPEEDTDGGFANGGWSIPYFDPEVMGAVVSGGMDTADGLRVRAAHLAGHGGGLARAGRRSLRRQDERRPEVRGLAHAEAAGHDVELDAALADDAVGDIAELRAQPGGDLVTWGSISLVQALLAAGLVDELLLMIEPIVLGGGKRIFPADGVARPLQLVDCVTTSTGVHVCTYRPA